MTLASSLASDRQRRIAYMVQIMVVVAAAVALVVRDTPLAVGSLVPALIIAQLMTTYLLAAQSMQQRCPATALLAGAYVVTMVSYNIAPRLAFGSAGSDLYPLFGVIAHVGFAGCFVAYAFLENYCNSRVFGPAQYRTRFAAILAIAVFVPLVVTAMVIPLQPALETQYALLGWLTVTVTSVAFVIYSLRVTPTVTNMWMRVALLADLVDAVLVASTAHANSVGIFSAQVFGLITCAAMPAVYIIQFNWMYAKLAGMTQELQRQALLDQLTDVGNRRRFDDHISRLCEAQVRGKLNRFSLLLVDIDDFKLYNDTYGHPAGDECLRRLAQTIQRVLYRPGDEIARYGGEEFVVILQAAGPADASLVADRIRRAVFELAIPHKISAFGRITVSIGVASAPDHGNDPKELIAHADTALYESKRDGKNRVTRYLDTAGV